MSVLWWLLFSWVGFAVCVVLLIYGHSLAGALGTAYMLLSMAGLMLLLYLYNRKKR